MQSQPIAPGLRLGPYEILLRLGAGGMGEVWSARDTRLDRRVAIKVLPAELARDPQFRLRFEREAKTISQLSHPHICTLFDVGDDFLVMELLEGETLAERIARGPLPLADILRYGVQIAEALANAHRAGIVHRDLKPANVMITKGGAKLLDFGLAKPGTNVVSVDGATQQKGLTQEGTILGTFQYMAPEQLEGEEADARTDIFAFGAMLYEMATGRRAFDGKTRTSLIAAIVSSQPVPIAQLQPLTPPSFEHIVMRCLSKQADDRWQNAHDVAEELRWISATSGAVPAAARTAPAKLPWLVAGVVILASAAAIGFLTIRAPKPRVLWSDIAPPRDVRLFSPNDRGGYAIAPDGTLIAFLGKDSSGLSRVYVRDLRSGEVRAIPGTERSTSPFWSPDSRSIAFFSEGKLKRIDADGTRAGVIAEEVDGRGGAWGRDGTIVFAPSSTSGLARVRASGGKPELFTKLGADQISHRFPSFLPDGKHVLFVVIAGQQGRGIHVASLDGSVQHKLLDVESSGVFSGDSIVFINEGALFTQKLDMKRMQVTGEPVQIASNISGDVSEFFDSGLSASSAGDILFPAQFESKSALVWRDRSGAVLKSIGGDRIYMEPAFSPDEKRVAASSPGRASGVWEVDLERGRSRRLIEASAAAGSVWSPDGERVVFQTSHAGKNAVMAVSPNGGKRDVIALTSQTAYSETFSPDRAAIVLSGPSPGAKDFDLWTLNLSDRKIRPLVSGPGNQTRPKFSPDGQYLAYSSDETGRPEIFMQTNPPTGAKWQVTFDGGDQAHWRGDGRELFILGPDGKMLSVAVTAGDTLTFGDPVVLFQSPLTPASMTGNRNQFLSTRDGQRFLLVESANSAPQHLTLITNFAEFLATD